MGIADIAKRTLWLRADDLSGADGSSVNVWRSVEGALVARCSTAPTVAAASTPAGGKSVRFNNDGGFFSGRAAVPTGIVAVTASSSYGTLRPEVLFTGSGLGTWSTDNLTTGTVTVQYSSAVTATGVTLYARTDGVNANQAPKDFTVEASNDGSSWTTLHTVTGATPAGTGTTYSFTNPTGYTYYRLNVTAVQTGGPALGMRRMDYVGAPTVALTGASAGEVWVVVQSEPAGYASQNSSWGKFGTSGQQSHYAYSGTVYDDFGNATRRSYVPTMSITSTFRVLRMSLSSAGAWLAELDGTSQATASGVTAAWPSTVFYGSGLTTDTLPNAGLYGNVAAYVVFNDALTSGEATTVRDELTATYITGAATVAAPVLALAVDVKDPTVNAAASGVTVAAPTLALAVDVLDPAVNLALTPQTVAAPAVALTVDVLNPTVSSVTPVAVAAPTLSIAVDVLAPTVNAGVTTVTAPTLSLTIDVLDVGVLRVDDPAIQVGTATYTGVAVIGLAPQADLAETVPVQRQSYLMPALDAAHPAYQPLRDYDVTVGLVGTVHLWIDHQDVTYLRGKPTKILRWDSEAPFGDKAAMFEFPQLDPWDVPGAGDLTFLRPDAPVTIGMVDSLGAVRVMWTGFLDSRGSGLGEGEQYTWEAKGTLWAAMHQVHEPVPYLPPTDIGLLVARALNGCLSRRFHVRERRIGIPTRTRGARDQWVWQYVQDLLSEAWTEDGRQWTLVEVAPGEYDLQLKKAMTTVDATVAFGTPLVDIDLRIDESTRVDEVFARGYSPAGGAWANMFYPGLELARPPAYPYTNPATTITLGTVDADTDSGSGVSDWQERARKLGYTTLTVTGVMSSAWVTVVRKVQGALGILVDGVIGPQTWNATFDSADLDIDLTPLRLPMAMKSWTRPVLYGAAGVVTGPNPNYDPSKVVRQVALSLGQITKADARPLMRTYLAVHGEAVATGTVTFIGCPNEVDRTRLTHGDNLKILGFEGRDVVVQLASKSVALDDDRSQYVVSFTVDESARDALTVEQLLERNRAALADPSRRPGNPNRDTRNVKDQGFTWDAESPCGVLPKTAVNGAVGLWSCVTIPFAEVGQLAGLRLHGTHPFAVGIFASLRITENKLARMMPGGPFANSDPWRSVANSLDEYGWIAGWGEQGDGCGYSPGTEADGFTFSGDMIEASTLEYVTETPPYVTIALYMRGSSGYVWGEFEPAEQT